MGEREGQSLNDTYRIVRKLGQGAMSDVYLLEHRRNPGTRYALKVLKPHLVHQTDLGRRFREERETMARLDHPGIVKVHDSFDEAGAICMVLAHIEGESLADRLRERGAMAPAEALPMFKAVLVALDYAHQKGVIHRDLKPSNILIDTRGRPLLCDFGIAKQVGRTGLTAVGTTLGTPQYMSPEQIQAPQTVDHRSDLYSAGVVLYEMLTGRPPFGDDDTASDYEILRQQVHAPPPDPRVFRPDLAPVLVEVLRKALKKSPGERMHGGMEFHAALVDAERVLGGGRNERGVDIDLGGIDADPSPARSTGGAGRRYAVYQHPAKGRKAVPIGFSTAALLFGPFWMLAHGLFGLALLWFGAEAVLAVLALLLDTSDPDDSANVPGAVLGTVAVLIWAMPALRGQQWREGRLVGRGYVPVGESRADSAKAAIAAVAR